MHKSRRNEARKLFAINQSLAPAGWVAWPRTCKKIRRFPSRPASQAHGCGAKGRVIGKTCPLQQRV
jgi:hypothetical protein